MNLRLSKVVLTSHILFSIGWFGAVAVFLVFAIAGLLTQEAQLARSCYMAMEFSAWFVIVPFGLTSLLTGIIMAVFTKWGLLKHYWVVVKLILTLGCTVLLLLHLDPISALANTAWQPSFSNAEQSGEVIGLIAKSGAALLVLLIITTISVYKPWGKIQVAKPADRPFTGSQTEIKNKKTWVLYLIIGLIALTLILSHLFGGGMRGH